MGEAISGAAVDDQGRLSCGQALVQAADGHADLRVGGVHALGVPQLPGQLGGGQRLRVAAGQQVQNIQAARGDAVGVALPPDPLVGRFQDQAGWGRGQQGPHARQQQARITGYGQGVGPVQERGQAAGRQVRRLQQDGDLGVRPGINGPGALRAVGIHARQLGVDKGFIAHIRRRGEVGQQQQVGVQARDLLQRLCKAVDAMHGDVLRGQQLTGGLAVDPGPVHPQHGARRRLQTGQQRQQSRRRWRHGQKSQGKDESKEGPLAGPG